ncbi:MAG: hypothetical protein E7448_03925 [Ruminococcaceae bacterium]|nr:hypothetical protein [Oscillospiraceae bacterium]
MDAAAKQTGAHEATVLLSDDVHICLEKNAGSETFRHSFVASTTMAALNAIGIIIVDLANMLEVAPAEVLSSLAVVLLSPEKGAVQNGKADN